MEKVKDLQYGIIADVNFVKLCLHIIYDLIKLIIIRIKYEDLDTIYCL